MVAARRYGIDVVGHVPDLVGLEGVLAAGQHTVEHLDGFPASASRDTVYNWSSEFDPARIGTNAVNMRIADTWMTPTLVVLERADMSASESRSFLQQSQLRFLPPFYRRFCCGEPYDEAHDLSTGDREKRRLNRMSVVKALRDEGVRLLLGSDTGNRFVLPGTSAHDELDLLVEAGLTPFEAIRAGTRDAALALGRLQETGTIESGKRADLLLVRHNPLDDVSALSTPLGVMIRGSWHSARDLDDQLERLAENFQEGGTDE
jgi:imidazolonepropionase-like amidohydrolase